MKNLPGTRFLLISTAVSLTFVVAVLLFAETPKPAGKDSNSQLDLRLKCVMTNTDSNGVTNALKWNPSLKQHPERYTMYYDDKPIGNGTLPEPFSGSCTHMSSNVTQHGQFVTGTDLEQFLQQAGLAPARAKH